MRRGVYFSCSCKKRYQKKHAKKGYANRKGYALIYLDIAQLFFFPKRTIRLYFNSRSALKEGGVRTWRADVVAVHSRSKNPPVRADFFLFYPFIISYAPRGTYLSYGFLYFIISRTNVELTNESSGALARITVSTPPVSLFIAARPIS